MRAPMPNRQVTFIVPKEEAIVMVEGRVENSRLIAQCAGIDIYLDHNDNAKHPNCLSMMMQNLCLSEHIPLSTLHYVNSAIVRTNKKKTETKEMF